MKNKKYTIILSGIYVLDSIAMLSIPYFSKGLIDSAEMSDKNKTITFALFLVLAGLVSILFRVIGYFLYSHFTLLLEEKYKKELLDSIERKSFKELSKYHSAEIEMLFTTDIQHIISKKLSVIPTMVRLFTRFTLAVFLLLYYDWKFLVLLVASGAIGLCGAKVYSKLMKPRHKRVLEASGKTNSFIVEEKEGLKIIQSYQAEEYAKEYYHSLLHTEIDAKKKRNRILYTGNSLFYVFSILAYIGPVIYGAFGILNSWFTYGVLLALTELVAQIENPLLQASPLLNQYNLSKASEERIEKAIAMADMPKREKNLDFDSIEFQNVSFAYDQDHEVLKNVSFTIEKGDTVLFSGASGIGKTTTFMLLMGFLAPTEGKIILHRGEEEILLTASYGGLFSYVPQENMLFSGTIRENMFILTGKEEPEMIEALKKANIYDEIMAMPLKLDTVLKDHGDGLSLGQIQRILIACAILHDAPILLLDEFSSALDAKNEDIIIENLKKMNKTIVYITHRNKHMENQKVITYGGKEC